MPRPVVKAGCIALCVSANVCVDHAHAAEWQMAPSLNIGTSYADNPRLRIDGGSSAAGAVGELNATFKRLTERSELTLRPRLYTSRYNDDDSLSSDDQFLTAGYRWLGERSEFGSEVGFTRDSTLTSELGLTGLVQTNRRHEALTLSVGPKIMLTERVSAGAQLFWLASHYQDAEFTGLVDYDYGAVSLYSSVALSEAGSSLTVTAQAGELSSDVPGGAVTRDGSLRLGWTHRPWERWTVSLSAGPSYVDTDYGSDSGVVFDAEIKRQSERWSLSGGVARSQSPSGRGVLTRRDRASLSLNRAITERLSATVSAQWIRNEDLRPQFGVDTYSVDYGRLDVTTHWRMARHWSLALQLAGNAQDYETASQRAEGYRASLSMVWNGQPQSL